MAAIVWPRSLWPSKVMFDVEGQSASGGPSESGYEQVVVTSSGRVIAKVEVGKLHGSRPNEILSARALKAHMRGRANSVLVGPCDAALGPAGLLLGVANLGPYDTPFDDDALFSDGTGFDQLPTPAIAGENVASGSEQLYIIMTAGHVPQPGQWFGLKDKEIHLIDTVGDAGGGLYRLTFTPTLRDAVIYGETINFDWPTCEMRARNDVFGQLDFQRMFEADFSVELVECPP